MDKLYIAYDERYSYKGDDASVLFVTDSGIKAFKDAKELGYSCFICEYDNKDGELHKIADYFIEI